MLLDENEKKELKEIETSFSEIAEHRKAIEKEVYSLCRVIFAAMDEFNSYQKIFTAKYSQGLIDSYYEIRIRDRKLLKKYKEKIIAQEEIPTRGFVISDKYDVFIDFKKVALDFMKYYNDIKKESMNNSIDVLKAMNELS